MIIEIYINNKLYECELTNHDIGIWKVINQSENIKDIDFNIQQTEYGFTDKIELYLK